MFQFQLLPLDVAPGAGRGTVSPPPDLTSDGISEEGE